MSGNIGNGELVNTLTMAKQGQCQLTSALKKATSDRRMTPPYGRPVLLGPTEPGCVSLANMQAESGGRFPFYIILPYIISV